MESLGKCYAGSLKLSPSIANWNCPGEWPKAQSGPERLDDD